MAESGDYAGQRAVMDCGAIGEPLPPIKQAVLDELNAAAEHCRLAAGRLQVADTLQPPQDHTLELLVELLDNIQAYLILQWAEGKTELERAQ